MNQSRNITILCAVGVLLFASLANAQAVRTRKPSEPVVKPPEQTTNGSVTTKPGNFEDAVSYIDDVRAEATHNSVAIRFYAAARVRPIVEIGEGAPRQKSGSWVFPTGRLAGQGSALESQRTGPLSKKVGTVANTLYTFDSKEANLRELAQGETFHFIISIPRVGGSGVNQTTGTFTTKRRLARVVFDSVKIINDGDPDPPPPLPPDCGEIDLWFWANYGEPNAEFLMIRNLSGGTPPKACSDHFYNINRWFVVDRAPDVLVVSVSGRDRDRDDRTGSELFESDRPAPIRAPLDAGDEEQNVALNSFDLRLCQPGVAIPFKLVSMRARGGGQGDLMFEVHGHITVTYSTE